MSFRRRMVLLAAGAVAAAIVIASVVVYVVTGDELRGGVDASLREKLTPGPQAVRIQSFAVSPAAIAKLRREGGLPPRGLPRILLGGLAAEKTYTIKRGSLRGAEGPLGETVSIKGNTAFVPAVSFPRPPAAAVQAAGASGHIVKLVLPNRTVGGPAGYAQLVPPSGQVLRTEGSGSPLPVTAATRAVASGRRGAFFSNATIAGTPVRILTERAPEEGVWQVALPLTDVNNTLAHLKLVLALVSLGGIALAAALGLLVSRTALIPVRRLTGAAERVARTQDLGHRIEAGRDDDLGRLAASFNTMLAALERSRLAQRRLVSDASHELRTPLTSVQANLDALAIGEKLSASERARVLDDARAQLRDLAVLVGDLVDLSKTEVDEIEVEDVRLDLAAAGAIGRARLHAPHCRFALDAEPCLVAAAPARLERAIANLLDNACKHNPSAPVSAPSEPGGEVVEPGGEVVEPGGEVVEPGGAPSEPGGEVVEPGGAPGEPESPPIEVSVRAGVLQVRDHGPGISAEDLPRVFDRFYRAPGARARAGSGLGLAIVRQFAETHGGAVHAANDPGGGARLTLELPPLEMTLDDLTASEPPSPARTADDAPPGGPRVSDCA